MNEKILSKEVEALKEIIDTIETLVSQCPPTFSNAENKIFFLRHAVIKQTWAISSVAKADVGEISWIQFTTDLQSGISLH